MNFIYRNVSWTETISRMESAEVQPTKTISRYQKERTKFDSEGTTTNQLIVIILIILTCCIGVLLVSGAICYCAYQKRMGIIPALKDEVGSSNKGQITMQSLEDVPSASSVSPVSQTNKVDSFPEFERAISPMSEQKEIEIFEVEMEGCEDMYMDVTELRTTTRGESVDTVLPETDNGGPCNGPVRKETNHGDV